MLWPLLKGVFDSGDTYAFAPGTAEADIQQAWIDAPEATFVALADAGELLGSYTLKPNHPGLGSHVCNCGYLVATAARGGGVATTMCEHSQQEARLRGYRAMQFNLVVSTNTGAVRLWQQLGFSIAGTLPQAFRHAERVFVDAYVMHKHLQA